MEQVNVIEIVGNVGNASVKQFGDSKFVRFSVANNFVFKTKEGTAGIETTWINVAAWEGKGMPEDLNLICKGASVRVIGRLRQQKYTGSDGVERQSYEVSAKSVELISPEERLAPGQ